MREKGFKIVSALQHISYIQPLKCPSALCPNVLLLFIIVDCVYVLSCVMRG